MLKLLLAAFAAAGDVVTLTDGNFEDFLKENPKVLVKFYAPWCGHCKKMAPEFEQAATDLKDTVPLADVDSTVEKECSSKHGVSGYPTLKWFVNGEPQEYGGGRTASTIVEWVKSMSGPAVSLEAPAEPTGRPVVIQTGKAVADYFEKFADKARQSAQFFFVQGDTELITLQHQGEDKAELKEGDADKLQAFFDENKMPLVGELNGDTYESYTKSEGGLIWCLFKHEEGKVQDAKKENLDFMLKVAKGAGIKGKFSVTFTDTVAFAQAIEGMLGVTEFPAVVVQKKAGGKQKFVYDGGDLEAEKVIKYITDVSEGKITAKLKSEAKPETQGDIKVVVGDTLNEIVFDAKRDVLFEVYAPWCGHCKKLEPEYELLAKKVTKDVDDLITIAKMDGTANDSPTDDIDWSGFPTIKYIRAGSKTVEAYEGGRTAKDMWAWIRENSSHKDEITKRLTEKYKDETDKHDEL
jgi:protein disulfide-isomerase/protein disulfide-isomerase A1